MEKVICFGIKNELVYEKECEMDLNLIEGDCISFSEIDLDNFYFILKDNKNEFNKMKKLLEKLGKLENKIVIENENDYILLDKNNKNGFELIENEDY